jgi:hypothetical protein
MKTLDTRAGTIELAIPKLRHDSSFDSFEEEDENYRYARFTPKNSYVGRVAYVQYMLLTKGAGVGTRLAA